jgi:hypothetical protein
VSRSVDRELVIQLLQDESLSFREIARRAKCSDWSVRSIASEFDGDRSSDDATSDPSSPLGCAIVAGIALLIVSGLCFASWRMPPRDGGGMK